MGSAPISSQSAYVLLLFVIIVFGVTWPAMKFGLVYLSPLWFASLRAAIGSIAVFALLLAIGQLRLPPRRDLSMVASGGVLQVGAFLGFTTFGLQYVEASRSAILSFTVSIWLTPLAILFLGERLTWLRFLGLATGLGGVAALLNPAALDWGAPRIVLGNLCLLAAALCWAIVTVHIRKHKWVASPLQLTPWQLIIACGVLAGLASIVEGAPEPEMTWQFLTIAVFVGAFGAGFGFCGIMMVSRTIPAITLSIMVLASPMIGIASSVYLLGELITVSLVLGVVLILCGVVLVSLADYRSARTRRQVPEIS